MAQSTDHLVDQIAQLNAARNLVLGDAAFYPQIVNGVLPLIGANTRLELRQWGAEFLAETFASPALASAQKEQLAPKVLQTLREILELPERDPMVLKHIVQNAASLYPLVFRHIINHPAETTAWENMTAIKQDILRRWDSFPFPVKICCINDPLLVNATLNCLAVLIRTRQSVGNKIINAIMNFYPARQVRAPITPSVRVSVKSMERTARAVMINILKRNPNHPLAGKMQQYIDRLMQSRIEVADEASRKRGLPSEPTDGLDNTKRAKLDAETPALIKIPPLPPGPISYSQLFTLTEDRELSNFDVKQLPTDIVLKIVVPLLGRVDQSMMQQSIEKQQAAQPPAATAEAEDDDDYEPEYQPMDIPEPAAEQAEAVSAEVADLQPDLPPPLTEDEAADIGRSAVGRVFGMLTSTGVAPNPAKGKSQQQLGFARLAGSTFDRDAWVTLLTRLATRAPAGLEPGGGKVEKGKAPISDSIRETLYRYILEDFRGRVNIGIMWLNEEWYNDRMQMEFTAQQRRGEDEEVTVPLHYDHWVLRLLDGFLPYLDSRDTKIFIRFLSEIPEVTIPITKRVASLAKDPERVNLCIQSLLYLIMFRPPAREMCLNALEDVYDTYEESRPLAGKLLAKW
ncbi:hypothetical protein ASPNIDRAFT_130357, partial [Aspergillus niger ATCC 1015]